MEYVYASLLLHAAKKEINEEGITKVLEAAGVTPDAARAKALVAALEGVNIEEAISKAAMPVAAVAAAPAAEGEEKKEKKEEESEEEKEKKAEEAAAGLGALFG